MNRQGLRDWLDAYQTAWVEHDAEAAGQLFTPDARYHQTPFEVFEGREEIIDYWARVTPAHEDIQVTTEILGVDDDIGFARFYAEYTNPDEVGDDHDAPDSVTIRLDGVCLIELEEGQCSRFREWWHRTP